MTSLPDYHPVPPSGAERRRTAFRQALRLPNTVLNIHRIIREDLEPAALDEHLWSFRGFHLEPWDRHYQARLWPKVTLGSIQPQDVAGMPASELALMLHVAMEIEEPILDYSHQSGEGLRLLLPALGRFMGKDEVQARYAAAHGGAWCESPWCAEERRHANTFARLIERIVGMTPVRNNPNDPMTVTANEADAVRLIIGRQSSEWNASSTYVVMAAHARGALREMIRNVARDEIKHLAILSAADAYLFGPRPWRRVWDMVTLSLAQYRGHRRRRSAGAHIGANVVSSLEVIVAHLLVEHRMRRWLASVPLRALAETFETPSHLLPEPALPGLSPEEQAQLEDTLRLGREARAMLGRWAPRPRRRALAQRQFDDASASIIEKIVATRLDGLAGAGFPGSPGDRQTRARLRRLGTGRLRTSLVDCLRQFQISHNRHVLAREAHAGRA